MSVRVTIVGRAGCGACNFTKRAFELAGMSSDVVDVDQDENAVAIARDAATAGKQLQLPVVIHDSGERRPGLRMDRIAEVVRAA